MTSRIFVVGTLISAALASVAKAQAAAIPVRALATPDALSPHSLSEPFGLRELSDGRVIVNDVGARRVLLFDATLAAFTILADTIPGAPAAYGPRATGIIAYPGDSTLIVDIISRAFVVVAPDGTIARTMAAPRTGDVAWLANAGFGAPGIDPAGRLVYRAFPAFRDDSAAQSTTSGVPLDSAPIIRADFETRRADTVALLGVPRPRASRQRMSDGRTALQLTVNPLPLIDDWALLPDGSLAILRGHDYHLDWIATDGARSSTPKMPFDWRRLSAEDKQAIVDSTKRAIDSLWTRAQNSTPASGGQPGAPANARGGGASMSGATGGADTDVSRQASVPTPAPEVINATELPDYIPPVLRSGAMRADRRGCVWILPSTSTQSAGGLLYDVVDRKGEIVERVRIPAGRTLAGFGANDRIYLTARDSAGTHLERTRVNRPQ